MIPFAKLPILNWESDDLIDGEPAWEGFLLTKAKLNGVFDISGGLQEESTFNVGQIDVWGNDNRKRFNMDMQQTQLRLWSKRKTETGDFIGYLEGDFWTDGGQFRLRHCWFDYKFLHIGQDWSFFGDKDVWPNVFDWDGPPSGVWRRDVQIKFYFFSKNKNWKYEFGFENPGPEFRFNDEIDPDITPTYPVMPDIIGAVNKKIGSGYLRLSAIYRHLVYDYNGSNQNETGTGASLSGYFVTNKSKNNVFQFQFVGGKGIASYLASFGGRNYDGIPNGSGGINTVPVIGSWVTYEHWFNKHWHANIAAGFSDFKTDEINQLSIPDQGITASNTSVQLDHRYILVNVMYSPVPGTAIGVEYNWGNKDVTYEGMITTPDGSVQRVQQGRDAKRISFGVFFDF